MGVTEDMVFVFKLWQHLISILTVTLSLNVTFCLLHKLLQILHQPYPKA